LGGLMIIVGGIPLLLFLIFDIENDITRELFLAVLSIDLFDNPLFTPSLKIYDTTN
jgi:hypothetical protein